MSKMLKTVYVKLNVYKDSQLVYSNNYTTKQGKHGTPVGVKHKKTTNTSEIDQIQNKRHAKKPQYAYS